MVKPPIPAAAMRAKSAVRTSNLCLWVAVILAIAAVLLIVARQRWANDLAALLAPYLSADGVVTEDGVERLRRGLLRLVLVASVVTAALVVAQSTERRHRLGRALFTDDLLPDHAPWRMLVGSFVVGMTVLAIWMLRDALPVQWLFRKEGSLETLTVVFLMIAAGLCVAAAKHWLPSRKTASTQLLAPGYALLAAGLFFVAMEEISWGQQIFGFATPAEWARMNHQQETTVHNLVDTRALKQAWSIVSITFSVVVCIAWFILAWTRARLVHILLPHPALVPLGLMVGVSGTVMHAEIAEFLIGFFALCYALRARRIAVDHSRV